MGVLETTPLWELLNASLSIPFGSLRPLWNVLPLMWVEMGK